MKKITYFYDELGYCYSREETLKDSIIKEDKMDCLGILLGFIIGHFIYDLFFKK